jgi:hypothetical protein
MPVLESVLLPIDSLKSVLLQVPDPPPELSALDLGEPPKQLLPTASQSMPDVRQVSNNASSASNGGNGLQKGAVIRLGSISAAIAAAVVNMSLPPPKPPPGNSDGFGLRISEIMSRVPTLVSSETVVDVVALTSVVVLLPRLAPAVAAMTIVRSDRTLIQRVLTNSIQIVRSIQRVQYNR